MNKQHTLLLERLEDSAAQIAEAVKKLSPEELTRIPAPGEWSLHRALAHLRDTEVEVFAYRTARILKDQEAPTVASFNQDEWSAAHYSPDEPIENIVKEFRAGRRKLLNLLRLTRDKDWARHAIHPEYGNIPIEYIALHAYNHTLEHLQQLLDAIEVKTLKAANG
ncbi:MAG: DinB family protein [Anaerolineae bacterium]|nr:DinB family protein [Anaerolineae bacterium]